MNPRMPPHSLDAELSILGGLMLDPYAWEQIVGNLSESDFYKTAHKTVFTAIGDLQTKGQPVDIITVSNLLAERGELERVGGAAAIADIINSTPTAAHVATYAKIVREKALLRRLISTSSEIIDKSYSESYESVESFLDEVEANIFSIGEKKQSGLVGAAELIKVSIDKLTELSSRKSDITGVASGFRDLDKMTAGFQPGELTIIAARPSMGKTAFSLNCALHAAIRAGKTVAYFSVEMAKEQLMMRMLASEARVSLSDLKVGSVADNAWPRLIDKAAKMAEAKIFIDDTSGISPYEIRAKCRRLKAQQGLDIIMVDYLQLMSMKTKIESREREVAEISKSLKAIAKELEVPVIALAQLNRGVEGRTEKKPMLSDLRESGSIEQDADIIMMLYREEYYDRENPDIKGQAEVIVGKHRNGATGAVKLKWEAAISKFGDYDEAQGSHHPLPPPPENPRDRFGGGGNRGGGQAPSGRAKNYAPGAST